jgi:hypothetical protein
MRLVANCKLDEAAPVDLWDYHMYSSADDLWFKLRDAFDGEEMRAGPHIFVSEYAAVADGWGTLQGGRRLLRLMRLCAVRGPSVLRRAPGLRCARPLPAGDPAGCRQAVRGVGAAGPHPLAAPPGRPP